MKIIITEKTKEHMECHNKLFKPYTEYLTPTIEQKILRQCKRNFNIVHITFNEHVGKTGIVEIDENDEIFWAKRKGRNIYSRFVKGRVSYTTPIITFILKKQYDGEDFNLISMYPSLGVTEKEVFDPSIRSLSELERSISFWSKYAFTDDDYVKGTEKDIIESHKCLYNSSAWFDLNYSDESMDIDFSKLILKSDKLYLKNLYFGSEITKQFDEDGYFVETECQYTGLRFTYMCNGYEYKIGYAGNSKNDFAEEMALVG